MVGLSLHSGKSMWTGRTDHDDFTSDTSAIVCAASGFAPRGVASGAALAAAAVPRPDQRGSAVLPVGFHGELRRRHPGRQRRAGMPEAKSRRSCPARARRRSVRLYRRRPRAGRSSAPAAAPPAASPAPGGTDACRRPASEADWRSPPSRAPAAAPKAAQKPAAAAPAWRRSGRAGMSAPLGPVRPMLPRRARDDLAVCRADQRDLLRRHPARRRRGSSACLAQNGPHLSRRATKRSRR